MASVALVAFWFFLAVAFAGMSAATWKTSRPLWRLARAGVVPDIVREMLMLELLAFVLTSVSAFVEWLMVAGLLT